MECFFNFLPTREWQCSAIETPILVLNYHGQEFTQSLRASNRQGVMYNSQCVWSTFCMMGAISAIYVCYLIYFSQQPSEVGAIIHYFLDEEAEAQKLTNLLKFIQLIRGGAWI